MKRLYWRPSHVSRTELVLVALLSLAGLVAVETFPLVKQQPHMREKLRAAHLAKRALDVVKQERLKRNIPLNLEMDPMQSGLIGEALTPVTSTSGHLSAKQTSINPNFAALIVHYLKKAHVEKGDLVALGVSGSFPAINVAAYAACQALGLKPIIVASTSASQWGANHPDLTWLDMEAALYERNVFRFRSVAASRGGIDDRALGMTQVGKTLLDRAMQRNGVVILEPESYEDSVRLRMSVYEEHAKDRPIRAYINVGGGTASVGTSVGKKLFEPGLNSDAPYGEEVPDSVMLRFLKRNTPVIHMIQIVDHAERFGFQVKPTEMPSVGQGRVFVRVGYNPWVIVSVLIGLLLAMFVVVRLHLGFRLRAAWPKTKGQSAPTEMV